MLDDPTTRYLKLDLEELAARAPEVLLPSEPYEFGQADADEVAATFAALRAG